jgi:hypothetical protein
LQEEICRYQLDRRLAEVKTAGLDSAMVERKNSAPAGDKTPVVQAIASHYCD